MHTAADIQTGNPDIDLFAGTGGLPEDPSGYPSVVASGFFFGLFRNSSGIFGTSRSAERNEL